MVNGQLGRRLRVGHTDKAAAYDQKQNSRASRHIDLWRKAMNDGGRPGVRVRLRISFLQRAKG